jgi:hypothetical protein
MLRLLLLALLVAHTSSPEQIRLRTHAAVGSPEYWVDDNGAAASWAACLSATPLSGASACTMTQANANAAEGHTINFRAGTYNTQIAPTADGTYANRITYQGYNGEAPEVTNVGSNACVQLTGRDYIKVTGFILHDCNQLINLTGGSSYNEFANNVIRVGTGTANIGINIFTLNAVAGTANSHNWFHDNTIYDGGYVNQDTCNDISGMASIGADSPNDDTLSNYNTFEDNTIYWGAHHALKFNTHYNVARNNVMHNEDWTTASAACQLKQCAPNGLYGNRVINVLFDHNGTVEDTYNLIEGNRLGFAGLPSDGNGADVLTLGGQRDIARYNDIYAAQGLGLYARQSSNIAKYLSIYNNTIAFNGLGPVCRLPPINPGFLTGAVRFPSGAEPNFFVNNILNSTTGTELRNTGNTLNIVTPNWQAANGNPQFTDATYTDPFSLTAPDFTLQAGSGAIDTASHLAIAVGAGSSSTSLVASAVSPWFGALPFQDGTRGSDLVRLNGTMHADWIAIGTVSNTVQISSIDYATNTITLASAKSWSDGASVWLYKKSDGVIVLVGTAPDYGAHEKP